MALIVCVSLQLQGNSQNFKELVVGTAMGAQESHTAGEPPSSLRRNRRSRTGLLGSQKS